MKANKYFAELEEFGTNPSANADLITDWLSSLPIAGASDPIAWWSAMEVVGHPLAKMALDFLSTPG